MGGCTGHQSSDVQMRRERVPYHYGIGCIVACVLEINMVFDRYIALDIMLVAKASGGGQFLIGVV